MRLYFFAVIALLVIAGIHWSIRAVFIHPASAGQDNMLELTFFDGDIQGAYVSQGYGRTAFALISYTGKWHNGIDISVSANTPIVGHTNLRVVAIGNEDEFCPDRGYGRYAVLHDEARSKMLLYAHLGKISVRKGDEVMPHEVLADVGHSGFETGPHLHFTVFEEDGFEIIAHETCGQHPVGKDIDPFLYLNELSE